MFCLIFTTYPRIKQRKDRLLCGLLDLTLNWSQKSPTSEPEPEWVGLGRYDIIRSVFLTIKEYLELFSCNLIYGYNYFHIFTCYACMFMCNIERIAVICWPEFLWKRGNFCLPLTLSILILSLALINCGHIVK